MSSIPTKKLFNVHAYHQMGEAGILSASDRVELICGEILVKEMIGPAHCASVDRVSLAMFKTAGHRCIVRTQGAVRLDEWSEPEPDVVLLRSKGDFYASKLPGPEDILLIVEVSDSSLKFDTGTKSRLYAETGVPEFWVVDLQNDCLFAYSNIQDKTYRTVRRCLRGDTITPLLLPDCAISVVTLLP